MITLILGAGWSACDIWSMERIYMTAFIMNLPRLLALVAQECPTEVVLCNDALENGSDPLHYNAEN